MRVALPINYYIDNLQIMITNPESVDNIPNNLYYVDVFDLKDNFEHLGYVVDEDYYRALGLAVEKFVLNTVRGDQ